MTCSDAEKVLGPGEKTDYDNRFEYASGVKNMYRDDKVAGIYLDMDSAIVSVTFDDNGYADTITLLDQRMATLYN